MFHQLFALIVNFFFKSELDILKRSSQHTLHTFILEKAPLGVLAQFSDDFGRLLPLGPVTALLRLSAPLVTPAEDLTPALGRGHSSPL